MKKNRMLRMASALLILTLLTTSVIGGTFAKYVSTGSVSDTARVAKWGVEIKTSGTLYSNAYAVKSTEAGSNLPIAWVDNPAANAITVATATGTEGNIIAPGTESYKNGLSFGVSGKPEVAVKVTATIKAEDIFLAAGTYGILVPATVSDTESLKKVIAGNTDKVYGFKNDTYSKQTDSSTYDNGTEYYILTDKVTVDGNGYFPVKYKLAGSTEKTDTTATAIADEIIKKIDSTKTNDKKYTAEYTDVAATFPANTDLGATGTGNLALSGETITWAWPIETGDTDDATANNNLADTLLGDLMAMRAGKATTTDNTDDVDYVIVDIKTEAGTETITALDVKTDTDNYTVTKDTDVVANLNTKFDIILTVEQVD